MLRHLCCHPEAETDKSYGPGISPGPGHQTILFYFSIELTVRLLFVIAVYF